MEGSSARRRFTRRTVSLAAVSLAAAPAQARRKHDLPPIEQPATADARSFMERAFAMKALAERSGDQGFGAVVVKDNAIIGEARSRVVTDDDPTAHAEMEAVRDAARRVGRRRLNGAQLYSSFRPCPMCEAAAAWAGITRMTHGEALADAGAPQLRR